MSERPMKLLIVEDEENIRNLLMIILDWEKLDIQIVGEASTGAEALDLAEELLPDIVLTDIQMPYMDGLEATKRIRELESDDKRIPIVAMTANVFDEDIEKCHEVGMVDHIGKPIDFEILIQKLKHHLKI